MTIPRILFRTVPAATTDEAEHYWRTAQELHPSPRWAHITYREPINPTEFPIAAEALTKCSSGAQRGGLIRLEALLRHGGIYIDSDVELYRPLDSLLGAAVFAGYEDANVIPDAVLGAAPGHPIIRAALASAVCRVNDGQGAWATGPGITTDFLGQHADEVLLLPPGAFYPVHYNEKARLRSFDRLKEAPWSFGLHHWRHSWKGH